VPYDFAVVGCVVVRVHLGYVVGCQVGSVNDAVLLLGIVLFFGAPLWVAAFIVFEMLTDDWGKE